MNRIFINNISREFELELCKVNRNPIGTIPTECLKSIRRGVSDIDSLEISINKYIYVYGKKTLNPLWYDMKEERIVCLNKSEYFSLKRNSFSSSENKKDFTAYSLETRLSKVDVKFENIAIHLLSEDIENKIYSIDKLLFEDTGWHLGHIDDSVLYDTNEQGEKTEKLRIQESVNKRWYDYIKTDICESFGCIAAYDTLNKAINLYDIKTFGENVELYLSNDNYIKNLQRESSSENIVTRLNLIGREEMDIVGATVSGYPYIEDYSYFMDNDEMSEELMDHLEKYYEMVEIRTPIWKQLLKEKQDKIALLIPKKTELYQVYAEIKAKKSIKEVYAAKEDAINEAIIAQEIALLVDRQTILEVEIQLLEEDVTNLNSSVVEINILCKRETATDENGELIFNEKTLAELKDFVYCDTYTNDAFLNVDDLLNAGKRELSFTYYPSVSYVLDLDNFINKIRSNGFNAHWKGDLGIGDIIILHDEDLDKEVPLYVNGYTQYPNAKEDENELDIAISNKKLFDSGIRVIADRLKESELATKLLSRKVHLLNKQKYNRINIDKTIEDGSL